jgi:chromosome segregation ATPase
MITPAAKIRALGVDWPGSKTVEDYAVISAEGVDLGATLHALEQSLSFCERELSEMYAFQRKYNADWNDVTDHREDYSVRAAELRRGIATIKEVLEKIAR